MLYNHPRKKNSAKKSLKAQTYYEIHGHDGIMQTSAQLHISFHLPSWTTEAFSTASAVKRTVPVQCPRKWPSGHQVLGG